MATPANLTPDALSRLVYVSRRLPGVSDTEVVDRIALTSMRRNRTVHVTGCLWFGPTNFFQVLEGEGRHVSETYERILADRRHTDIRLLDRRPIDGRDFARFAMRVVTGAEPAEISALIALHADARAEPAPGEAGAGGFRGVVEAGVRALAFWRPGGAI